MTRLVSEMMYIVIPVAVIMFLILLAWKHVPVHCHTGLNSTAGVVLSNLGKCIDDCWRRHDFGSDLETDDCYVVDVFIQDRDLTKEDFARDYVNVYFDTLEALSKHRVKVRYNATGKEISLVKIE